MSMKHVSIIQHTQSEWIGLMEDHLEGRRIRFSYFRPFTSGGSLPHPDLIGDGLMLVGGGPWGTASDPTLPTLKDEISLARTCLMLEKPIIGIGLGAQILSIAGDGKPTEGPLEFRVQHAKRAKDDALGGFLPQSFPSVSYMRDRISPPDYADILAVHDDGTPALFQIGKNAFGFAGHPGIKLAMIEDLIMESDDTPEMGDNLAQMNALKTEIEDALVPIMTGLIQATNWMKSDNS